MGLAHDRAREGETLLLASRQLRRHAPFEPPEAHDLEREIDPLLDLGPAQSLARTLGQRERDVVEDVHVWPDGVVLEDHADVSGVRRDREPSGVDDGVPQLDRPRIPGRSKPAIDLRIVVLPHPLGPRSVKNIPSSTVKLTSSTAGRALRV